MDTKEKIQEKALLCIFSDLKIWHVQPKYFMSYIIVQFTPLCGCIEPLGAEKYYNILVHQMDLDDAK